MERLLNNKLLLRCVTAIVIVTFLFTTTLYDVSFAEEVPASDYSYSDPSSGQGDIDYAPSGYMAGATGLVATSSSPSPTLPTATAVTSFNVDPSSGMGITSIPIMVPPGRQGMAPNINITYSTAAKNGLLGLGWSLNLGYIERSTKNGPPKYDDTDTFIINMAGQQGELVSIGSGEYRAKIEGAFTRYEFDGLSWIATDKAGRKYYLGLEANDCIKNSGLGIFRWGLSKIVDTNGNYLQIEYYGSNDLRPYRIRYTGNEATSLPPTHRIQFFYQSRQDQIVSYRSAFPLVIRDRLSSIRVFSNEVPVRTYTFEYIYHNKTRRSLLNRVTIYGKEDLVALPPITFTYNDSGRFEYQFFNSKVDLTQAGDNLWKARFNGNYERGHDNFGLVPPPAFGVEWSQIYSQSSGSWGGGSWNIDSGGCLTFSSGQDCANWFWTYLYVDSARTLNVPFTTGGGEVGVYLNGDYANEAGQTWDLKEGFNLVEITGYHQHQSFFFDLRKNLASEVNSVNSSQHLVPQLAGDFNGDGYTDLGAFDNKQGIWKVALSNGTDFFPERIWIQNFGTNCMPLLGDFDSDGKTDIASFDFLEGDWKVALSTGSSFEDTGRIWLSSYGQYESPFAGDFNGDGKLDVGSCNPNNGGVWRVALSDGTTFENGRGIWKTNFYGGKPYTADFNGDGLTDICLFKDDGSWWVCLSNGSSFGSPAQWITSFGTGEKAFVTDINGDGLADIGYVDYDYSVVRVAYSDGVGFMHPIDWLEDVALPGEDIILQMADFNGDGVADVFLCNIYSMERVWALSTGKVDELLSEVDNGMGATLAVFYTPSSRYDNRTESGGNGLPFVIQTVSKTTLSDGLGNDYSTYYRYSGGLYDTEDRELRGFRRTTIIDSEGNQTEICMHQDDIKKGKPWSSETKDVDGNVFSRVESLWDYRELDAGRIFVYLAQQDTFIYDGDEFCRQTQASFEYDDYGNPIEIINRGEVGSGDERRQVTEYLYNTIDWIVSLPWHTYLIDENNNVYGEKWFSYDYGEVQDIPTKGLLTKEEVQIDNPVTGITSRATTQYTYSTYGNLESTIDALGRPSYIEYETASYTYPVVTRNALGHAVRTEYDLSTGQLLETTDPNGLTTVNTYDSLGRLITVKQKYQSQETERTNYEYDFGSFPLRITQKQAANQNDASQYFIVHSFYDGLGRLIQTKSPAEDPGKQIISDTVKFDSKGRVKEKYFPYFIADSGKAYSEPDYSQPRVTFAYDSMGRLNCTTNPDGTYSTAEYFQWTVTRMDENRHEKKEYYDAYGNIVVVEEFMDGSIYATTHYEYDAVGNLRRVTDAHRNETEIWYDSVGRKVKMDDPDMGIWTYEYDLVGNLVKQTDAKDQTIDFVYDRLNRLTEKRIPAAQVSTVSALSLESSGSQNDITYMYDASQAGELSSANASAKTVSYVYDDSQKANCIGRLSRVIDSSGSTEFYYDTFGREVKSTKIVDGSPYTVERGYDLLDRLVSLKYPDGELVSYEYNNAGAMERIYSNSHAYVANIDYSPTGQITKIEYENGVVTEYEYNPLTLRLSHLDSQSSEGTIQDLEYEFDGTGNVTSITDSVNTATQYFHYDDLNRLIRASGSYGVFDYDCDPIGNMVNNKGVACYYGDNGKPHALTSTSDGLQLIYDENGNLIQKGEKYLFYDAENRLIKVETAQKAKVDIYLRKGWNTFSIPVEPSDPRAGSALSSLVFGSDCDQLVKYDTQAQEYKNYVHDRDFDQFSKLDYLSSYLIHVTNPDGATLTVIGDIPKEEKDISLKSGWNFVGSPFLEDKGVEEAFTGLQFGVDYDQVSRYNNDTELFENYNRSSSDTLSYLSPGDGTAVYCLKDTTWRTPVKAGAIDVEFIYDGDGGRVKKISPNSATTYIGSLYETTGGVSKKHVFAGSNRICTVESDGDRYFFHGDHLGSSNVITDGTGKRVSLTEYTPYGLTSVQKDSDVTNYKFTGKELDSSTGLYYYGARYYDPEIGRFTQPDTIVQAPYDPQTLNRYTYCRNNPVNYVDPTGHSFWDKVKSFFKNYVCPIWAGIEDGNWAPLVTMAVVFVAAWAIGPVVAGMSSTFAASGAGVTFFEGFAIGAVELGIPAFAGSLGGGLASGMDFKDALRGAAITGGITALTAGFIEGSYAAGWQNILHFSDTRIAEINEIKRCYATGNITRAHYIEKIVARKGISISTAEKLGWSTPKRTIWDKIGGWTGSGEPTTEGWHWYNTDVNEVMPLSGVARYTTTTWRNRIIYRGWGKYWYSWGEGTRIWIYGGSKVESRAVDASGYIINIREGYPFDVSPWE